jgi:putative methyltransferase (TIGR04325 family)
MSKTLRSLLRHAKRAARRLAPPLLVDLLPKRYIWHGIYAHYRDVPIVPASHDLFVERCTLPDAVEVAARIDRCGTVPAEAIGAHMLLGLLVAAAYRPAAPLRILDLGGGLGLDYLHLLTTVVPTPTLEYHIVEIPSAVREGERLYEHDDQLRFHSSIPQIEDLDIVLVKGALQYFDDPRGILEGLLDLRPRHVFLVNLSAGDFPTYATAQRNLRGGSMAYWFLNVGEVIQWVSGKSYDLVYKSALEPVYDQSNFPPELRMGRTCNLLFERTGRK